MLSTSCSDYCDLPLGSYKKKSQEEPRQDLWSSRKKISIDHVAPQVGQKYQTMIEHMYTVLTWNIYSLSLSLSLVPQNKMNCYDSGYAVSAVLWGKKCSRHIFCREDLIAELQSEERERQWHYTQLELISQKLRSLPLTSSLSVSTSSCLHYTTVLKMTQIVWCAIYKGEGGSEAFNMIMCMTCTKWDTMKTTLCKSPFCFTHSEIGEWN